MHCELHGFEEGAYYPGIAVRRSENFDDRTDNTVAPGEILTGEKVEGYNKEVAVSARFHLQMSNL